MTDPNTQRGGGLTMIEGVALAFSLTWLALMGWFFLGLEPVAARDSRSDPVSFMVTILGMFLPIALIWIAASAARTARTMREESGRLQAAIDAMRLSYLDNQENAGAALRRDVDDRLSKVAQAQATLGAEVASLSAAAPARPVLDPPERTQPPGPQQILQLGVEDEAPVAPPLSAPDFIRALNFPENERDEEGFRLLRTALAHGQTADLVKSAQDVLTLLSQDGIFMDDLSPHRAAPAIWRAFAGGARGASVTDLGGVRDRSSLALAGGRLKEDPVFRDAVHLFLRAFDRSFARFADGATDAEIARFADTRTARAFMLTGKVAGTFD